MWQYFALGIESEYPASRSILSSGSSAALGDHKSPVGQEGAVQGTHLTRRMSQTMFDLQVDSSLDMALEKVLHDSHVQ